MASPQKDGTPAAPPSIEVIVSADNLAATLNIIPTGNNNAEISVQTIQEILKQNNIIFGINEAKIQSVVQKFNREKSRVENEEIARGTYPKPGKQGPIKPTVLYLSERPLIEALLKQKPVPHISDIMNINSRVKRVNPGDVVARRGPDIKGTPGQDVLGKKFSSNELVETHDELGPNITSEENGQSFRSTTSGVVVFTEGYLNAVHVDFDAQFQIEVSLDKMEARATFIPPGEGGTPINAQMIQHTLSEQHVTHGLIQELLQETANRVNAEKRVVAGVVIARGQKAVDGTNGKVEYFFNTSGTLKPKEMEDGSVNFKDITVIESVAENQELARIQAPTKGEPGFDVTGGALPARDGAAIHLPMGSNTGPHPGNADVLISLKSGIVRLAGHLVEISEGYFINGDVDFSTGNIKYAKSVKVKRDIKSGFLVDAGGDLDVAGIVEDATIKCEGNVLIKGGFIGSGKGEVNANGSVNIGFIRNQTVKSRGDVTVAREAINAKIFARNNVSIFGKSLSAVGGKISARNEITGTVFGNNEGTKTELEVGMDFTMVDEKYKTEEKIKELGENRKKVGETLSKFDKIKKIKKTLQPKQEFLFKKLSALAGKLDSQLVALEKRKEMIEEKLKEVGKARITFKDRLMPGTLIKIGDRHFSVQEEILGPKSIMLINGEIKFL